MSGEMSELEAAARAMMKVLPACDMGFNDNCPWCRMNKALMKLSERGERERK